MLPGAASAVLYVYTGFIHVADPIYVAALGRAGRFEQPGGLRIARFDATKNLRFTVSNDFGNQNPSKYLGTPVLNNAPVDGLQLQNYNVLDAHLNFTDNWTNLETLWTPSPPSRCTTTPS